MKCDTCERKNKNKLRCMFCSHYMEEFTKDLIMLPIDNTEKDSLYVPIKEDKDVILQ